MATNGYGKIVTSIVTVLSSSYGYCQIEMVEGLTPQQLVEQYLLGPGVSVSNITFNGLSGTLLNDQISAFYGSNCVLAMDSGIVLVTGLTSIVYGPNNNPNSGSAIAGTSGDPDLSVIASAITDDAAILEFDFIPGADSISFRFAFASEEYLEWVDSQFNDVFGFFISGPGINGSFSNNALNLAVVPGTDTYVTINTINQTLNSEYYVNNGVGGVPPYSTDSSYIEFDGFTTQLCASIIVESGQTYHIKIAIADASDGIYDSGVFIVGGTFSSVSQLNMEITTTLGGGNLVEGCGNGLLTITRTEASGEMILPLVFTGTATDLDVDGLPDEVVIPDSVAQIQIQFTALIDGIVENGELLEISTTYDWGCIPGGAEASAIIIEAPELVATIADVLIGCEGNPVELVVGTSGGLGPAIMIWDDGTIGDTVIVPGINSIHSVTVTDTCGQIATAAITIETVACMLEIPNVFTPDNNGSNDFFEILGIESTKNAVRIFNRWGTIVYQTANYGNTWDGDGVSNGTYFYEIIVEGHPEPYIGHLTILN
ncbi:MAG: gliding motility-associated C-terminal domain-containing protein [Bacteroidota bacterium]|nr:gliding motility-associated C-terminal domain-containing protein [Bacteroidota bacterium]